MTTTTVRTCFLLAGILWMGACGQPSNTDVKNDTTAVDTDTATKAITAVPDLGEPPAVPDTQFIVVDSMVNIQMNDQTVPRKPGALDSMLAGYWLQCYQGTQKLPKFLRFKYQGTVMMGARGNLMDAVVHVQDSIKDFISREKFQQEFHRREPSHHKALDERFPVLFQRRL